MAKTNTNTEAKTTNEKKQDDVSKVVEEIKDKFGEGMLMKLGEIKKLMSNQFLPVQFLSILHWELGVYQEEELLKFMDQNLQEKQL